MRIVQLLPEMQEGGVERGVLDLNRELVKRGFESIIISAGGRLAEQIKREGGEHYTLPVAGKNPFTFYSRMRNLRKTLAKIHPDMIHIRSRFPAWLFFFANKSLKLPVISTVHGFNSVSRYSKIMTKADQVICVSNSIREYIQKHYAVSEKIITVIPRGVDLEKFNPQNLNDSFLQSFENQYDLKNSFVATMVGRITQTKDLGTFIKAISLVKRKIPHIKGLIAGGVREDKQSYFVSLKKMVKELELEKEILFCGSQKNISEIYHLSDIIVSSSKKPESFGRSAAEALAMNRPVIATNHGGILDIVKPQKTGFLFEVGESEDLAEKIIKIQNLKLENLQGFVEENFTLEKMVEETIKVYKKAQR